MTDFPTLSHTSTCEIPALLYLKPEKRGFFGVEPSLIDHYREYTIFPSQDTTIKPNHIVDE